MRHLFLVIIPAFSFSQEIQKDSIQLYYPTAEYSLSETHKNELTVFHSAKSTDSIKNITVTGYTDFVGNNSYNTNLAEKRIQNVIEFLNLKHSGNINQINIGELNKPNGGSIENGVQEHRKTNISYSYIKRPKPTKYTYLQQIDSLNVGDKIRLRNINFLLATAKLTKKSIPELDNLFNILNQNKNLHIEIEGHVCCGGKDEVVKQNMTYENEWLSNLRAKTISNYLTDKGIDSLRLRHKGYGFTKPLIYPEETEGNRYKNRRIEIVLLNK